MKKFGLKLMAAGLIGAMAFSMVGCSSDSSRSKRDKKKDREESQEEDYVSESYSGNSNDNSIKKFSSPIGSMITMGNYYGEPLNWIVIDEQDGNYLVLSEKAVNLMTFSNSMFDTNSPWETCPIREWLNGEFYNDAFTVDEQNRILLTDVKADTKYYEQEDHFDVGNDTQDKLYLLAEDETEIFNYEYVNTYFEGSYDFLICEIPECIQDKIPSIWENYFDGTYGWWLRTPGKKLYADDYSRGSICKDQGHKHWDTSDSGASNTYAVRPVMWISAN